MAKALPSIRMHAFRGALARRMRNDGPSYCYVWSAERRPETTDPAAFTFSRAAGRIQDDAARLELAFDGESCLRVSQVVYMA